MRKSTRSAPRPRANFATISSTPFALAPASINIRPASSATMASGSSAGAEPLSSGINVSIASIFSREKICQPEKCYQQNGPSQLNFETARCVNCLLARPKVELRPSFLDRCQNIRDDLRLRLCALRAAVVETHAHRASFHVATADDEHRVDAQSNHRGFAEPNSRRNVANTSPNVSLIFPFANRIC